MQLKEFKKSFQELKQKLDELKKQQEEIKKQNIILRNEKNEIEIQRKQFEKDKNEFNNQLQFFRSEIGKSKPKGTKREKQDSQTQEEMADIQVSKMTIRELLEKKKALELKYKEENDLWKSEKQRLINTLQLQKEKNDSLKLTISQFSTPTKQKKSISPEVSPTSPIKPIMEEPIIEDDSSPQKSINHQTNDLEEQSVQFERLSIPHYDYDINFDYHPIGEGIKSPHGKEIRYPNGDVVVQFRNGTCKIRTDSNIFIFYNNGDILKEFDDGAVAYFFANTGAIELTLPDSTVVIDFPSGQKEAHFPNGDKYVLFPNGSSKYTKENGDYQIITAKNKVETHISNKFKKYK